jgi:hypothetical protein
MFTYGHRPRPWWIERTTKSWERSKGGGLSPPCGGSPLCCGTVGRMLAKLGGEPRRVWLITRLHDEGLDPEHSPTFKDLQPSEDIPSTTVFQRPARGASRQGQQGEQQHGRTFDAHKGSLRQGLVDSIY